MADISDNKFPLPPCRVCSAPGTGFHYGVNSCEACKGFFHRSQAHASRYKCDKEDCCTIQFGHRMCRKCRLQKCIAVGMSKSAIKTGRYDYKKKTGDILEVKKLKVMEELERSLVLHNPQRSAIDIEPVAKDAPLRVPELPENAHRGSNSAVASDWCGDEPLSHRIGQENPLHRQDDMIAGFLARSRHLSPSYHDFADLLPGPNQQIAHTSEFSSFSSQFNVKVGEPGLPLSSNLKEVDICSIINFHGNPPPRLVSESQPSFQQLQLPPPQPQQQQVQQAPRQHAQQPPLLLPQQQLQSQSLQLQPQPQHLSQHTETPWLLTVSPETIPNPSLTTTLADLSNTVGSDSPSSGCAMSTSPTFSSLTFSSLSPSMPTSPSSPSSTPSASLSPMSLTGMDSSSIDASQALRHCWDASHLPPPPTTTTHTNNVDMLYQDMDEVVKTLMNAHENFVLPYFEEIPPEEIEKQQREHYENCRLHKEMFGNTPHLENQAYDEIYEITGIDVDNRKKVMMAFTTSMEKIIQGMVFFAKAIPGFSGLTTEDKIKLIKYSRSEFCFMNQFKYVNSDLRMYRGCHRLWQCTVEMENMGNCDVLCEHINFLGRIKSFNLTTEDCVMLRAMVIMAPDRCTIGDTSTVTAIHSKLVDLFIHQLSKHHDRPMLQFAKIMSILTECRTRHKDITTMCKQLDLLRYVKLSDTPLVEVMYAGILFDTEIDSD